MALGGEEDECSRPAAYCCDGSSKEGVGSAQPWLHMTVRVHATWENEQPGRIVIGRPSWQRRRHGHNSAISDA
eukprot:CAMPEP_0174744650 /NCGR_PEP_ID=MMETSP1094-20130205/84905_1 /TAXON_ID=156173 /ORGANISM="Chrysochromulina brevifilum, Strain UTEX LB 985" /LENGTH=72 /DNA_ID=CAMNT_0015949077 /DNA_START=734 /DNA_END=952 /DNA_ORIENTATION=+